MIHMKDIACVMFAPSLEALEVHNSHKDRHTALTLHVEYAWYTIQYEIPFIFSLFMNTVTLHIYTSRSYTGLSRRNTSFVFLWLRPRNM